MCLAGLLPKSLFAWPKTFFDKSKACSRPAMQRDSPRFITKKRFNGRSKEFLFGQQPVLI
jgi:hypothetical protein